MTSQLFDLTSSSQALAVQFAWEGDRFVHTFCDLTGQRVECIQGDAARAWPPSPPIQQISAETLDGHGDCLLGVGSAGQSHYSMSVRRIGEHAIRFEWACRFKIEPEFLGTTYPASDWLRIVPQVENSQTRKNRDGSIAVIPLCSLSSGTAQWGYDLKGLE